MERVSPTRRLSPRASQLPREGATIQKVFSRDPSQAYMAKMLTASMAARRRQGKWRVATPESNMSVSGSLV
jgi:hypothetical protein